MPRVEQPRARLFVAFIALTAAGSILVAPSFGLDDWQPLWVLFVVQPARIAFYVGYFVLGIYAERRGWFSATGFRPDLGPWGWGCVLAGLAYLGFRMSGLPTTVPERAVAAVLFATFCLTAVIAGIALFQRVARPRRAGLADARRQLVRHLLRPPPDPLPAGLRPPRPPRAGRREGDDPGRS